MPAERVEYTPKEDHFTARALNHKRASIIHNLDIVRARVKELHPGKWRDLPKGSVDHSVTFVPVMRGANIVALLRCSNKLRVSGEPLFNCLDVRRAEAFATVLHTWQSAVDNESRFTSSLLDIAHELRLSAAGIKARAQYVDIALATPNIDIPTLSSGLEAVFVGSSWLRASCTSELM